VTDLRRAMVRAAQRRSDEDHRRNNQCSDAAVCEDQRGPDRDHQHHDPGGETAALEPLGCAELTHPQQDSAPVHAAVQVVVSTDGYVGPVEERHDLNIIEAATDAEPAPAPIGDPPREPAPAPLPEPPRDHPEPGTDSRYAGAAGTARAALEGANPSSRGVPRAQVDAELRARAWANTMRPQWPRN
jgi:hypothetical protein